MPTQSAHASTPTPSRSTSWRRPPPRPATPPASAPWRPWPRLAPGSDEVRNWRGATRRGVATRTRGSPARGKISRAVGLTASIPPGPLTGRRLALSPRDLRWTIGAAIAAAAAATSVGTAASEHTEFRGLWIAGSAAITWGFMGVGLFVWARRPDNRVGPLMVAVAFSWVVSDLVFANSGLLFSVGSLLSQVFIAVTVHLLLVFPTGRFESRLDRLTAVGAYLAACVLYVVAFTFADPDRFDCSECPGNSFLIADDKAVVDTFSVAVNVTFAAVAVGGVVRLLRRLLRAAPGQRRGGGGGVVGGGGGGAPPL